MSREMFLTGKCKKDFEKWYYKNHCNSNVKYKNLTREQRNDVFGWFYNISTAFKFGIYQDFFETKGFNIETGFCNNARQDYYSSVCHQIPEESRLHKSRKDARIEAVLEANDIYNFNNKKEEE
jgi:hypothetical protein